MRAFSTVAVAVLPIATALAIVFPPAGAAATTLYVATASNFAGVLRVLTAMAGAEGRYRVRIATGSSGKHFAQIVNGAPFDAFFSADAKRPEALEQRGLGVANSRFTYAIGRLVAWQPGAGTPSAVARNLRDGLPARLAIANPRHAPYGVAARQTLQALGSWHTLRQRLVLGENIAQTLQFVHSGNAAAGLVARSQWIALRDRLTDADSQAIWPVPATLHDPIEQQAIALSDRRVTRHLLTFMRSEAAKSIIREHGYGTP